MQSQCCCSDTCFRSLQFLNLMARKMKVGTTDLCYLLLLYFVKWIAHPNNGSFVANQASAGCLQHSRLISDCIELTDYTAK